MEIYTFNVSQGQFVAVVGKNDSFSWMVWTRVGTWSPKSGEMG